MTAKYKPLLFAGWRRSVAFLLAGLVGIATIALTAITPATAAGYARSEKVALVPNASGRQSGGGVLPTSGFPDGYAPVFSDVAIEGIRDGAVDPLVGYDTVVLNSVCDIGTFLANSTFKARIEGFVSGGGKLIIWDSECPSTDYSGFALPFQTHNPGQLGAVGTLVDVEENTLSSSNSASSSYVNVTAIATQTDAVGDANVFVTYDSRWFVDLRATNAVGVNGPAQAYANLGAGLIIYCGLDKDYLPSAGFDPASSSGVTHLNRVWLLELLQPWDPDGLPNSTPATGALTITPAAAEVPVGDTHSITARLIDPSTGMPDEGAYLTAYAADSSAPVSVAIPLTCHSASDFCLTNAAGEVSFTYSQAREAEHRITVFNDRNLNNLIDTGEPRATATVSWVRDGSVTWLALGDSYSAGWGLGGTKDNEACRTSANYSYAGQAKFEAVQSGHTVAFIFRACGGATTADVLDRVQPGTEQRAQVEYVQELKPDIVTLTIGGNDIGFGGTARNCILNSITPWLVSCPVDSNAMRLENQKRGERKSWDGLYDRLVKTYVAIRKAQPADGQLHVLTYPVPFSNPLTWDPAVMIGGCNSFSVNEAKQANATSVRLGDTIYWAVQEANRQLAAEDLPGNVHFVDWRPTVTTEKIKGRDQRVAYDDNGVCSAGGYTKWATNGLVLPALYPDGYSVVDSFHPTRLGYSKGADALGASLEEHAW